MRFVVFLLFVSLTFSGCGNNSDELDSVVDPADDSLDLVVDPADDFVAFIKPGEQVIHQMQLDGNNSSLLTVESSFKPKWEGQQRLLNNTCGGGSGNPDNPIRIFSPDGAFMGLLDDSWIPSFSPDRTKVAVSCGLDDDGKVIVVSNVEKDGSSEGWSRESSARLSDRMEIYIFSFDGSNVTKLTKNTGGDWLPRWSPIKPTSEVPESIAIESNRDGNSEIYFLATMSTASLRITENDVRDQSPAFTKNGFGIAFASELLAKEENELKIIVAVRGNFINSKQEGRPVDWPN